jgi:hypothetical protein
MQQSGTLLLGSRRDGGLAENKPSSFCLAVTGCCHVKLMV